MGTLGAVRFLRVHGEILSMFPTGTFLLRLILSPAPPPQRAQLSDAHPATTLVHFLSVYFFSVYTRSPSAGARKASMSSNFWRRQRHPFFPSNKKESLRGVAISGPPCPLLVKISTPPSFIFENCPPCRGVEHTPPTTTIFSFGPWVTQPRAHSKLNMMRTAILPGIHLNPSDFRS